MNLCLWCDTPCDLDVLCPSCRAVNDHPLFYCQVNPAHLPTLGDACCECTLEAERKARIERANAPLIAQLRTIRANLIGEWHTTKWNGLEHGKALVGMMIDSALKDLGANP